MVKKIEHLIAQWGDGNKSALNELIPLIYGEIKNVAKNILAGESKVNTISPTVLVNELYFSLSSQKSVVLENKTHFLSLTAKLMRRVLLDYIRYKSADKRGAGQSNLTLETNIAIGNASSFGFVALNDALEKLQNIDARQGGIVELKFFGGLTTLEISEILTTSERTIKREWAMAKAWLFREMTRGKGS